MLEPDNTNKVSCSLCGWWRILDATREYRGGHTSQVDGSECHGQLYHEKIDDRKPDPLWFEETSNSFVPTWDYEFEPVIEPLVDDGNL